MLQILTMSLAIAAAVYIGDDKQPGTETNITVRGRITHISGQEGQVTIRSWHGEEMILHVDAGSKLQIRRQDAKLADFRPGQRVKIVYDSKDGVNRIASMSSPPISFEDVRREIQDAYETAKAYSYERKDEYEKKLEPVIQDMDERIEELKERAAKANAEARQRFAKEIDELKQKRGAVKEQMGRVKAATPQAWEDVKSGVGSAVSDLQKAFEKARARLQSTPATNQDR